MAISKYTAMKSRVVSATHFRSLQDVDSYLKTVKQNLDDMDGMLHAYQLQFARLQTTAAQLDFIVGGDNRKKPTKKGDKITLDRIDKVVVPDLKNLKANFGIVEELYEQVDKMDEVYNTVSVNFAGVRGVADTLESIKNMKRTAQLKLEKALQFLHTVGSKHAPNAFRSLVQDTIAFVSSSLQFEKHETLMYAYEHKGNLGFAIYIKLKNLLDDKEHAFPTMFLVFTCILNPSEVRNAVEPSYYVTVMRDFAPPGKFGPGKRVAHAADASNALGFLLEMENVVTGIGVVPHGLTDTDVRPDKFSMGKWVKRVGVDPGAFEFELKKDTPKGTMNDLAVSLQGDLKRMASHIKDPQFNVRRFKSPEGNEVLRFALTTLPHEDQISLDDLQFLEDNFDIDPEKLKKIVRIING